MDSAIRLLSNWPQVVNKGEESSSVVCSSSCRLPRHTHNFALQAQTGEGEVGKWLRGLGKKSPQQEHWEDLHENEEQPKKKKTKQTKEYQIFFRFSACKTSRFSSQPRSKVCFNIRQMPGAPANAYSQERIKLYPLLIFYSSYGPVYYFSYPEYSRILLSEGLHKTPRFLLANFSLSVLSCRCGLL